MAKKKKAGSGKIDDFEGFNMSWLEKEFYGIDGLDISRHIERYYEAHGEEIRKKLEKHKWFLLIGGDDIDREYMVKRLANEYVEEKKLPILKQTKGFYSQKDINMSYYKYLNLKGSDSTRRDTFLLGRDFENADIKLLTNGDPLKWVYEAGDGFLIQLFDNPDMLLYLDKMCCDDFALLQTFLEEVYDIMVHPYDDIQPEPARLPGILIISVPSGEDFKKLWEEGWCNMFRPIDLEDIEIKKKRLKERNAQEEDTIKQKEGLNTQAEIPQGTKSKTAIFKKGALYYDIDTRRFRFNDNPSAYVSKTSRGPDRNVAEELMRCWKKGTACPSKELVRIAKPEHRGVPLPQNLLNIILQVRKVLLGIGVHMPQCRDDKYPLPQCRKDEAIPMKNIKAFYFMCTKKEEK